MPDSRRRIWTERTDYAGWDESQLSAQESAECGSRALFRNVQRLLTSAETAALS